MLIYTFKPYFLFKYEYICCSIVSRCNFASACLASAFNFDAYISSIISFNYLRFKGFILLEVAVVNTEVFKFINNFFIKNIYIPCLEYFYNRLINILASRIHKFLYLPLGMFNNYAQIFLIFLF